MMANRTTAVFNPLTQVANIHGWWASDPLWTPPADGAAVTSVRNNSGGGDPTQASAGFKPLYRASVSQLNNKPAVEFDGTDDRLVVDITDVTAPFKAISIHRMLGTPVNTTNPLGTGGGSSGFTIAGTNVYAISNGTVVAGTTGRDTLAHSHRGRFAPSGSGGSDYWLDGVQEVTGGGAGSQNLTWFKVGCSGATTTHGRFANCQVVFQALYTDATSNTDLANLVADLEAFYAI
jgi:hypothetical protein